LNDPENACLVIADITGYTDYLAGVELDHAQDVLADLMNVVVDGLRPPVSLAKLEGDAAFISGASSAVDGSTVQDTIESTYFVFRRRLQDINQATTCECNACTLIPRLDLKFVAHDGQMVRHTVAEREELVGRDVILVHRLLKNTADEKLGGHSYALYTDACVTGMNIPAAAQGLVHHTEPVDVIGDVGVWLRDLESAWLEAEASHHNRVSAEDAIMDLSFELDAPRPTVWDYLTSPRHRPLWLVGVDEVHETTKDTLRRWAGTTNHCMHGKDIKLEEILDWQANEEMTARATFPDPRIPQVIKTDVLSDLPDRRTKLEIRLGKPESDEDKATLEAAMPVIIEDNEARHCNTRRPCARCSRTDASCRGPRTRTPQAE
jgi:uncharacterized protein YndB with AHSA1/START domain